MEDGAWRNVGIANQGTFFLLCALLRMAGFGRKKRKCNSAVTE